ncbi:unnamed protein product [Rhizophagus irregularis]|nr:unnamed protein product [Rhizophagus irregularis]
MDLLMYQNMKKSSVQKNRIPSVQEFETLNSSSLCEFLKKKYNHRQEFLHNFEILKEQMIDGENFMLLTKQTLEDSPFKFSAGMILLIEDLIKKLKNQGTDIGSIETSMEKMNITENLAHSKFNDNGLL